MTVFFSLVSIEPVFIQGTVKVKDMHFNEFAAV